MNLPTVRVIAEKISQIHGLSDVEKKKMLSSIPKEVLDTKLYDENLKEMMTKIDNIRFSKSDELAALLRLEPHNAQKKTRDIILLCRIINLPQCESLDFRRKEIRFLSSVAATIAHQ